MKRRRRIRSPRRPFFAAEIESEPFRADWLLLSPGQRLIRSWRMRCMLKDPQAAHDALSLPQL